MQFFNGFGDNWHALEECLCYLDEWLPGEGYVLVVERAEELLCNAPEELRWFVAVINDVARWWAEPILDNGIYNRPSRPFQVVLEVSAAADLTRFERAGADVSHIVDPMSED